MTDKEFDESVKQYYKDKQKPENKTETIYVDVEKLLEEEEYQQYLEGKLPDPKD